MSNNHRTYTRRDSATAMLRKAGVAPRDYNTFITKENDAFVLDLGLLRRYQEQRSADHVKRTQRDAQEPNRFQGPQQGQDSSKLPKLTVSSVARRLILEGLTNEQVWGQLKTGFKLDDSKKHYPSWYRAQLKRDGKLEA